MPDYTPLHSWVMEDEKLTTAQSLIVCRVLKYGANGCYESSSNIGKALKLDLRTVQRNIVVLSDKDREDGQWLIKLKVSRWRFLFPHPNKLIAGPLWREMGVKIIKKITAYNMAPTNRAKLKALTA